MANKVIIHPLARADLFELYDFIATSSGAVRAGTYIDRIEDLCGALAELPDRGKGRPDLGAGVRAVTLERRVVIAYRPRENEVEILRILYAGREFSAEDVPD